MITLDLLVTRCPVCGQAHSERLALPPVTENYITVAKEQGAIGVTLPFRFRCAVEGVAYDLEVSLYRPYTRMRAIDRRAWPYWPDDLAALGEEALAEMRIQMGDDWPHLPDRTEAAPLTAT